MAIEYDEIRNGEIINADVEIEPDHDTLRLYVGIAHEKGLQGLPTYSLEGYGAKYIRLLLETVGVSKVSELKRTAVQVRCKNGLIVAIGHHYKDKWFNFEKEKPE